MQQTHDQSSPLAVTHAKQPLTRWLWHAYLSAEKGPVAIALIFMVLEGSMLGALSYIVQPMFDDVFIAGDRAALGWVAAAIAGIFIVRAISAFVHRVLMQGAGIRILTMMQRDLVQHLMTLDNRFFQLNPPGTLIERVRGDTLQVQAIWQTVLSALGRDIVSVIALLYVALSVDVVWTLIAIAAMPLLLGPILSLQRYVRRRSRTAREAAARLSTRLDEIFHGIATIKLNTSEIREQTRFTDTARGFLVQEMKARVGRAGIPVMTDLVAAAGFAGVLIYGGNQIIDGDKTVGEFMSFFTAMGLLFEPVRRIANVTGAWQTVRASLERVQALFTEEATIVSPEQPEMITGSPAESDITFEDVVLKYGSEPALDGVSFVAKAGETTALVGSSGAGKSTIFNALTRLTDATDGKVLVGNTDVTKMALPDLRALFSVVTQDAPMFDESLRDNIVLNTNVEDPSKIADAVTAASLGELVERLKDGLDTAAGPRGSALSGGQRQRVAIARALVRDAPILLLDEATSALDAESEKRVQAALDQLAKGRTTLVIAHRLSTIRAADKIIVMDAGKVVDQGTHDELLAKGGLYARLHALQFSED